MRGFTLIEIVVVFAIFLITTSVGMVTFSQFSSSQVVDTASDDMVSFLYVARSNAVSQTMLGLCENDLRSYSVRFSLPSNYDMWVSCNDESYPLKSEKLPDKLNFGSSTSLEVIFNVGSGFSPGGTIEITDGNFSKTIQIDSSGNITNL